MEANSEGENPVKSGSKGTGNSGGDGPSKPKRQMKTPFQIETLEKAYNSETYPSESTRSELSEKLGLTDRQLQMWFCHRRLKDKKETPSKKPRKETPVRESPKEELRVVAPDAGDDYCSGSGSGSSPFTDPRKVTLNDTPMRRYFESPQSIMELRAIACVEAQLGEPLREDGPILGVEFDPLPPGAFGAPIVPLVEQQKRLAYPYEPKVYERQEAYKRTLHEYQFLQDQPSARSDVYGLANQATFKDPGDTVKGRSSPFVHGEDTLARVNGIQGQVSRGRHLAQQDKKGQFLSPYRDDPSPFQRDLLKNDIVNVPASVHPALASENSDLYPDSHVFHCDVDLRLDRKRKSDEARIAKEFEAHEIRIRKELEKQDMLRRKNEERMRKELERLDRERKKEEERMLRERQREEEKMQREQKREIERREKFLQKEYIRAEKRKKKEELRREKEAEKRKAAIEKATARKIAKEALDLIEDEQLELMELAAASKGFYSIAHLDYDSLQSLDMFKDSLCLFPPESVDLKKPIGIQPWGNSEENIGNLLMAWRFFSTFADVLDLWPFTLKEFVQALHDYDSRLLGEMHISLLRLIIKDIEDVARTPTGGLGTNQYSAVNPEGGHPKIVEGAYMWGFDICNWQRYLSPLTWPEIFRQLALAAGFGPQLKKRSATWNFLADVDDVKGCEDTISTLRNGSAAENAFVLMREKGLLVPRRSRHRLTPGTVKFAAFHVLSLEGGKGLTVLELADKIQKSGLRDLTTSKTPEASISVALTRDQKLFERIAPSTYCVRTAFRKDPADAESILSSARKKIRMFENGFTGEDADDADRDEESEGDVDEDPEVDDIGTPLTANKTIDNLNAINSCSDRILDEHTEELPLVIRPDTAECVTVLANMNDTRIPIKIEPIVPRKDTNVSSGMDPDDMEIDESKKGESWIQGLTEGDYAHLSVEERLNALVALVSIANEGNTLRGILEERLEAANALKKQMWNEAQLDRSRLKEDIISKLDFSGNKELQASISSMEAIQNASPFVDINKEASPSTGENLKAPCSTLDAQNQVDGSVNPDIASNQHHGFASKRSRSQLKAYIGHAAEEVYGYRSLPLGQDRRRNRYWQFVASASKNDPCSGRIFVELHNGTWRTIDSIEAFDTLLTSLDPRGLRESHLRIMLKKIEMTFKESVKHSMHVGVNGLDGSNENTETDLSCNNSGSTESPSSVVCGPSSDYSSTSLFRIQLGKTKADKMAALSRYKDFQKWLWKESFNSSRLSSMKFGKKRFITLLDTCESCMETYLSENVHCNSCHQTFSADDETFSFPEHQILCEERKKMDSLALHNIESLPHGIKLLRALLSFIEVSIPSDALESHWTEKTRRAWVARLEKSSSVEEILQVITLLENAIRRDSLSSNFEMTRELLKGPSLSISSMSESVFQEAIPVLPWIPKTSAAVTLRLLELEKSIIYIKHEKAEPFDENPLKVYMKLPSRYPLDSKETHLRVNQQDEYALKDDRLPDMRNRRNINKRTRAVYERVYTTKAQRKTPASRSDSKRKAKESANATQGQRQQGRRAGGQGRGRRTVRKRRGEKLVGESSLVGRVPGMLGRKTYSRSARIVDEDEWVDDRGNLEMEVAENSNSGEAADSDDIVEDYERENWEQGSHATPNGWLESSMQGSDSEGEDFVDDNASADENGVEDARNEDSEVGTSDDGDEVASQLGNEEVSDSASSEDYSG